METFITLGIALGIGLLIGLQRERTEDRLGGIRTFPLISLFGSFCGSLARDYGAWSLAAGFFTVFGVLVISNLRGGKQDDSEAGMT
jgi:hypothetical protein